MFNVFNKIIFQDKKNCKTWNNFWSKYFYEYEKNAKMFTVKYYVRYVFKIQTAFKSKKHNKSEYFDQIILMRKRNLKLITFQANFWIIFGTTFTQDKPITRIEEVLVNLSL